MQKKQCPYALYITDTRSALIIFWIRSKLSAFFFNIIYSYEDYLSFILSWDPEWLNEAALQTGCLYKNCSTLTPTPVKERYLSFSEYQQATVPWLLEVEETWEN
ncbi:unnamed protein product, partial [Didymodactylos carnosus]